MKETKFKNEQEHMSHHYIVHQKLIQYHINYIRPPPKKKATWVVIFGWGEGRNDQILMMPDYIVERDFS